MRVRLVGLVTMIAALLATGALSGSASAATLPSQDPFYSWSGSLNVAPGTVLRKRTVQIAENGSATPITATQVLYRTTNELGQPEATVATILQPAGAALGSVTGTKIVSYQTAYDALGSECDPSYTLQGGNSGYSTAQEEEQLMLSYVAQGDTVVTADYEGENLDWGAGQESGYGTLDGIRAAEQALNLPTTTPVAMVGYSGGSIATDFAAEEAPTYAPSLNIVATAMGGVPVDYFHNLSYINGSPSWSGVIPAVLLGLSRGFQFDLTPYLSAYGQKVISQVSGGCINSFLGAYPGLTYQQLAGPQYQNIYAIPEFVSVTDQLIMGGTGTPRGPVFMAVGNSDGTGDGVMVARDVQELAYEYCQRGVPVQFQVFNGDDHTQAATPFETDASTFIGQAFGGASPSVAGSEACSSITPGNSIAPLAVPGGFVGPGGALGGPISTVFPPNLRLHFKYLGRKPKRHGIAIELWTTGGTLHNLTLTLRNRHGRRVARKHLQFVGARKRVIILRKGRRIPPAGRYKLYAKVVRTQVLFERLRVRRPRR